VGNPPGTVTLVESGPIAAAVTELPDGYELIEEDARAHLNVLIDLLKHGPVLPVRLGTAAPDDSSVRTELLDPVRGDMVHRLDALDGLVELHIDADDDENEAVAAVAQAAGLRPVTSTDLNGRLALGQTIAGLLMQRRAQLAHEILAVLRPIAIADLARSVENGPEGPLLRWAFLVKRDDIETFDQAVIALRSQHPSMSIRYVGPLPAVHFVDLQSTEDAPSHDQFVGSRGWGFGPSQS
jgi:hypothetical protein